MTDFSDQFRKIIMRYKRIGYNLNVMRQSACLVINPITVDGYAALFNCTPTNEASRFDIKSHSFDKNEQKKMSRCDALRPAMRRISLLNLIVASFRTRIIKLNQKM